MKYSICLLMSLVLSVSPLFAKKVKPSDIPGSKNVKNNPLVCPWKTPYQTPPFAQIKTEDYVPAILYAIEVARTEIQTLVQNTQTPTFENTIEALDASARLLGRVTGVFFNRLETDRTDQMTEISEQIIAPLTVYDNDLSLNADLFARVKAVYEQKDLLSLNPEQQRLLEKTYKRFARSGATLLPADKERYRAITEELSQLSLKFSKNTLKETAAYEMHLTKEDEVSGLPKNLLDQAAQLAKKQKKEGWVFNLSEPMVFPFLKYADARDLRQEIYRAYRSRAYHANEFNNEENVKRISALRLELAQLLGYETYANYVLEERMAQSVDNVKRFLDQLKEASLPAAGREVKELSSYAHRKGLNDSLRAWDMSYYIEKMQQELYKVSEQELKPYFDLEKVKEGIFALATRLYGLRFKLSTEISTYHSDVQVYEVRESEGRLMGILYLDFYARSGKRGGAWMTTFRDQYIDEKGQDVRPLVQMVLNFAPPSSDGHCLLPFSSVNTFLHEFGHALHGILSDCRYSTISGTSVPRDFVELPSQIMENWATEYEFLQMFAVHYQTGEIIPAALVDRLLKAQQFMAGHASTRQLSLATLDMAWHSIKAPVTDAVNVFESKAVSDLDVVSPVEGTNISVQFGHIFSGGYAAGYYGYKWAEVLDADAFALFREKGIFDSTTALSFRKNILSAGGSAKPMDLYVRFRGREPKVEALLERSGLKSAEKKR